MAKAESFRVCYRQPDTDQIDWGNAIAIEGRGNSAVIRFDDGGWNPAKDCFFTEAQCRRYHKLPPKDWQAYRTKIADQLERLAGSIRERA